ncbi:MAG: rhomboid family intramembrane serine protease [Pseudomonadota bacterium]
MATNQLRLPLWGTFDARLTLIRDYAIIPDLVSAQVAAGYWNLDLFLPFVTHPFIHASFLMTVFAGVLLLAIGKFVGEAMGNMAICIIFFASTIVGALAYLILLPDTYPLFGGYPAVYGLIGAYTFVRFSDAQGLKTQQMRAFQLLAFLMVLNLVYTLVFGGPNTWMADLVGAITGFLLAAAMNPGGIPHLLETLRRR